MSPEVFAQGLLGSWFLWSMIVTLREDGREDVRGDEKVGMANCEFFWLRLLLRVSTTPTTSLVVVGKVKSEISLF